ncbi:NRDE protein-domain-containing protein [Chaetomium fimeti]|uniref:NRDE protein-domain-containing protein n=1 Tax=Chaetomium fimeti TaxID=1854472 RepID=A0AAE0H9H4_9PEZI|nr:NRDE protein-domain-containing protein [Chaetomium fimeti]
MCIALFTTAHPDYALVAIDNRDEYILRPTSRPQWWTAEVDSHTTANGSANDTDDESTKTQPKTSTKIEALSSVDLQRPERGTWMGITKGGNFAVLTNYRETDTGNAEHPVSGMRSRGGMVTAWLTADPAESTEEFVHRMLSDGGVKGVGGFSLVCGKLRRVAGGKNINPLAIISNRCDHAGQVPWICEERGSVYGLSNAIYLEQSGENKETLWPKIRDGKELLSRAVAAGGSEEELIASLFKILDTDNFPSEHTINLEEVIPLLKNSIFIPALGGKDHQQEMCEAQESGSVEMKGRNPSAAETVTPDEQQPNGFQAGLYGTQRQTVMLVDWEGNATYIERALWDCSGNAIPRGQGDETFRFRIEGWEQEDELCN